MKTKFHPPAEAAEILGVSVRTLRRAVAAGELPCVKYNARTWRFSAVDLAIWHISKGGRLSATGASVTSPPPAGLHGQAEGANVRHG
jgi:excisionase family DNA binding protein